MNWKSIRLELARTSGFPEGSASRVYLLRLPLKDDGLIDEAALAGAPARATVRRYWPNEADLAGVVVRTPEGWALCYEPGEDDAETVFRLETRPIRLGEYLTVAEPDGRMLRFRVASLEDIPRMTPKAPRHQRPALRRMRSAALRTSSPR